MARFKITKKLVLQTLGVVALLAIMAGAGVLVWWLQQQNAATNKGGLGGYSQAKENTMPAAASEAQNLALSGDTAQAQQKISDALKSASGSKEKQQLYVQQGVTYGNAGDYQKALESYLAAEQEQSDFTTSNLIAETYEVLGDKAKAVEYYKKALSQMDANSPSYPVDKPIIEKKIIDLGGQV